ncbi:unnamed protein product, partial [Rotaria magnacalcarata]
ENCDVLKFNDALEFVRRVRVDVTLYNGSLIRHDRTLCDRGGKLFVVRERPHRTATVDETFSSSLIIGISTSLK